MLRPSPSEFWSTGGRVLLPRASMVLLPPSCALHQNADAVAFLGPRFHSWETYQNGSDYLGGEGYVALDDVHLASDGHERGDSGHRPESHRAPAGLFLAMKVQGRV